MLGEARGRVFEQHAILRAPGSGDAGLHVAQIERKGLRVLGLGRAGGVEELLLLVVGLYQIDLIFAAAGEAQVAQGLGVDGEDAACCAILGGHVADGGAVGQRQLR